MGNIDSRAKHGENVLFVKMNQPYYYPGNKVYGKIYIRAGEKMEPKYLEIIVKGKEKVELCKDLKTENPYVNDIEQQEVTESHIHRLKMFKY